MGNKQYLQAFLQAYQKNLDEALAQKTSWGRNDLKQLLVEVQLKTLLEFPE